MPRLPRPRQGDPLPAAVRGFPCFYGRRPLPRIITGDPWAYLTHASERHLTAAQYSKARAFIEQAHDFYTAAANPRQPSRPLLYYYAFLNLAKVLLLHKGLDLPPQVHHGVSDPRANQRQRPRPEGQVVARRDRARNHSELFPELVHALSDGRGPQLPDEFRVLDLMGQVPAIHRTYCMVTTETPLFCPVRSIDLLVAKCPSGDRCVWARLRLNRHDADVRKCIKTASQDRYAHVTSGQPSEQWLQSDACAYKGRGLAQASALGRLARELRRCGVSTLLTLDGYRLYLNLRASEACLPQFCSAYAIMFYLGSITRYKPYDFTTIVGHYSWLVNDFLDTQPQQMLYLLASYLAETEVVVPHAKLVGV